MTTESGIERLASTITGAFRGRAGLLQGRSALADLRAIQSEMSESNREAAQWLARSIEEVESVSFELELLRAVNLMAVGAVEFDADRRREIERLVRDESADGLDRSEMDDIANLQSSVDRWRTEAANPAATYDAAGVSAAVARAYEVAAWVLAEAAE